MESRKLIILVIEDNPHDQNLLRQILQTENYQVELATCRSEALESIQQQQPDLILLDVSLPKCSGYDLCKELIALNSSTVAPIVFISALNEEVDVLKGFEVGGSDFISKPIRPELLLARVRTHVQVGQLQGSLLHFNKNLEQLVHTRTRELKVSEERLKLALESLDGGIWDWNLETGSLYSSPQYHHSLGYDENSFPNTVERWSELIHPADREHTLRLRTACITGESTMLDYTYRLKCNSGEHRWYHCRGVVAERDEQHKPIRIVGSDQDITERKKTEELNKQLENHIVNVKRMESLGTLAGGLAHEFNNILAVAFGLLDLEKLKNREFETSNSSNLGKLETLLNRANLLVQQILTFSKHTHHDKQVLNLSEACPDIVSYLEEVAPENITLRYTNNHSHLVANFNKTQLHQILTNLFLNSIHAIGDKQGFMEIALDMVTIRQSQIPLTAVLTPGKYVLLSFSDNGSGIPDENQSRIFEPFFTTKKADNGTGMGLAIIHGIVSSHGGHICVDSVKNESTTFNIYIPFLSIASTLKLNPDYKHAAILSSTESRNHKPSPRNDTETLMSENESTQSTSLSKLKILFIDDEPELAHILSSLLVSRGIVVNTFSSPIAALEEFQAQSASYSIVVSDQSMPEMSGVKLAKHLKAIDKDIPILILTGLNDFEHQKTNDNLFAEVCTKPIKSSLLISKILSHSRPN